MNLHKTIQLAFNSGKGDNFYTKDNLFICISRNDAEKRAELLNNGFTFMPYSEVIKESLKTTDTTSAVIWKKAHDSPAEPKPTPKKPSVKRSDWIHPDIYEFSDADPGL